MINKDSNRRRMVADWTSSLLALVLLVAITVIVNYLAYRHYYRFDFTSQKYYTLSPKSEAIVEALDKPIKISVFYQQNHPLFRPLKELLKSYQALSNFVELEYIDPDQDRAFVEKFLRENNIPTANVIIVDDGHKRILLGDAQLGKFDYNPIRKGKEPTLEAFRGESAISGALLATDQSYKIYFTTGHGEKSLDADDPEGLTVLASFLKLDNFETDQLVLSQDRGIPADCKLLVIAGPKELFLAEEIALISDFLAADGRIIMLLDSGHSNRRLIELLRKLQIEVGDDVVVDPATKLATLGPANLRITDYRQHPVTEKLSQLATIFFLARSVDIIKKGNSPYSLQLLALTSKEGWGEKNHQEDEFVRQKDSDKMGPVPVVLAAEINRADGSRLLVIGDSDFIINSQIGYLGNKDIFLAGANWMIDRVDLIAVSPKELFAAKLVLTEDQLDMVLYLVLLLIPMTSALCGTLVWHLRNRT